MIRAAFDIETVSPGVDEPEFVNPDHFHLQSAGIAVEEDGEIVDKYHLTRDGWGAEHELAVIKDIAEHLLQSAPDATYTYNGERFDFHLLEERARIRGEEIGDLRVHELVEGIESKIGHDDLIFDAWDAFEGYPSLEASLVQAGVFEDEEELRGAQTLLTDYDHGFDHESWSWKDPDDDAVHVLDGEDVGYLGEHYLDGLEHGRNDEEFQELVAMLDNYVRGDVDHLFDLADARPYSA